MGITIFPSGFPYRLLAHTFKLGPKDQRDRLGKIKLPEVDGIIAKVSAQ
jgi:hypothetical protein